MVLLLQFAAWHFQNSADSDSTVIIIINFAMQSMRHIEVLLWRITDCNQTLVCRYITLDKGFTCVWLVIHNIPMIASHVSFCRLDMHWSEISHDDELKHGCQAYICMCNKKASWCVVNYYSRAGWNLHLQDSKVRPTVHAVSQKPWKLSEL